MTTRAKPGSLQKIYPHDFTILIAEVSDTAMKAIIEPDPTRRIQEAALSTALELRRLRSHLTPVNRRDPTLSAVFRHDVIRNRVIRDLATELVEAYERLKRAENAVLQTAKGAVNEEAPRKDVGEARRDCESPLLASS